MTLVIGQLVHHDRYRVDQLLGQGGMGAVYKAWDTSLEMPVAIKENLDASPQAQKQFNREANILAHLSHPNLPRVTDYFFITGQGQYLVMDYVEGEDLQSMLRRLGQLPEPPVLAWIGQISDALAYLHGQPSPIIHRDVKPANIRIRLDGRAMLVDFGIAKVYDPSLSTTIGAKAVTPGYSPPEQYGGGNTDPRSDVYALGATLYHLLTGKEPPESVSRVVNATDMPAPRQLNEAISPAVEVAILKSVEIPTTRRFQTMEEMHNALTHPPSAQSPQVEALPADAPDAALASMEANAESLGPPPSDPRATRALGAAAIAAAATPPTAAADDEPPLPDIQGQGFDLPPAAQPAAVPSATPAPNRPSFKVPLWGWIAAASLLGLCLIFAASGFALSGLLGNRARPTQQAALNPTAAVQATLELISAVTQIPTAAVLQPSPSPTLVASAAPSPETSASPASYNPAASLVVPDVQSIRAVEQKDGFAYLLAKNNTLYVFDLSGLTGSQSMAAYNTPASQKLLKNGAGLLRNGDSLYAYGQTGIQVLDIRQASKPVVTNAVTGQVIYNMILYGKYLIAAGDQSIGVYDASNPANPSLVSKLPTGENSMNFAAAVYSNMLYVSEYTNTESNSHGLLLVYSFSDPAHLKQVQRVDIGEVVYHMLIMNDHLVTCATEHVSLWSLEQIDYPHFLVSERAQARACVQDQGNVVANGAVFTLERNSLHTVQDFDPQAGLADPGKFGLQGEPVAYGSVTMPGFVFLAQSPRVLVLSGTTK